MAVIIYSNYFITDNDAALFRLGLLCNFFTVLFFASPLSTMVSCVEQTTHMLAVLLLD